MYKTRLQELCHRRSWELPQYSTTKTGLDHMPLFLTTVAVNGHSFVTPSPSRSSKLSQNDAARIAFDRLSPPDPTRPFPVGGSSEIDLADLEKLQPSLQDDCMIIEDVGTNQMVGDPVVHEIADGEHLYKNQLQTYAQRKNLALPVYTCEREGPGHAGRFRCKVEIDGKTFVSAEYFRSAKEAEHAAAKVALSSLSESNVKEGGFVMYKNLLQEFCQKQGYELPVYRTTRTGEVHAPTFASIVEISGENFTGQRGPTKKMAEMNAAKVAYTTLKECKASQNSITQHSVRRGQSSSFPYFAPQPVSNVSNLGGFVTETAGGSATGKASQNSIPQHSVHQGQSSSFPYFAPQPVSNVSNLGGFVTETAGGLATVGYDFPGNLTKKPQVHEAASLKKFPPDLHELVEVTQSRDISMTTDDDAATKESQHIFKNQLQTLAQRRNLSLPVYICELEGYRFRGKVLINGKEYETSETFKSTKQAEHAAAKLALTSMSANGFHEAQVQGDSIMYKNLLQEFTQKQGYVLPMYTTEVSGGTLTQTFISTVEVNGESFTGIEGRTKKLAEMNAAKIAYTVLKERTPSQAAVLKSFGHHTSSSGVNRDRLVNTQKDSITEEVLTSGASPCRPKQATDMIEFMSNSGVATSGGVDTNPRKSPDENERVGDPFPHPSSSMPASTSASICSWSSDSSAPMPCGFPDMPPNVIRIYPRSVNLKFPENNIVLSNENWVALSSAPTSQSN